MARQSPAQKIARITKAVRGWETFASDTVFYGKTLTQFRSVVQPSYDSRADIERLQRELSEAIQRQPTVCLYGIRARECAEAEGAWEEGKSITGSRHP